MKRYWPVTQSSQSQESVKSARRGYPSKFPLYRVPKKNYFIIPRTCTVELVVNQNGWSYGAGAAKDMCLEFQLSRVQAKIGTTPELVNTNVPNFSELSALFSQMQIWKVELTHVFGRIPGEMTESAGAKTDMMTMVTAFDPDNTDVPISGDELAQYRSFRIMPMTALKTQRQTIYPKYIGNFSSGNQVINLRDKIQWIDSANSTGPHSGPKYNIVTDLTSVDSFTHVIYCKYFYRVKTLK